MTFWCDFEIARLRVDYPALHRRFLTRLHNRTASLLNRFGARP